MATTFRPLAVVTGASSGIGYELAKLCARKGYDLAVASDDGRQLENAVADFRLLGATVTSVHTDLSTSVGIASLVEALEGRPVDVLLANAGHGLGHSFLNQEFEDIRHVINTNVVGTLDLIHRIGRGMRARGAGCILITGSIAGLLPGSYQAVYNATKAFINSFSYALRNELKDSGVTVTVLMPGPTDTNFFDRADMSETRMGSDTSTMSDPAEVAQAGFEAMLRGDSHVVSGWKNKLQAALAHVIPPDLLAEQHRKMAEPGSAHR